MKLPFTIEQFLEVFRQYNISVWPMQVVLNLLALIAFYLLIRKITFSNRIITLILSFLWLWMGVVYHWLFFSAINKAAILFGGLFIIQSLLFLFFGVLKNKLSFAFTYGLHGTTGIVLIIFALIIYPLIGYWQGHIYPSSPTFGLPCPTAIFTFGILLFSTLRIPYFILLVPFFWSLIGFTASFSLGIKEDISLLIAGLLSLFMIFRRKS